MKNAREILQDRVLVLDGAMGTYYKGRPGLECEQANTADPEGILAVHRAYLEAGAEAIKTNTFGLPRMAAAGQPGWQELAAGAVVSAAEPPGRKTRTGAGSIFLTFNSSMPIPPSRSRLKRTPPSAIRSTMPVTLIIRRKPAVRPDEDFLFAMSFPLSKS